MLYKEFNTKLKLVIIKMYSEVKIFNNFSYIFLILKWLNFFN